LALILLTLVVYRPALHAGFIWDDNDYVTANTNLHDAAGLVRIWTDIHSNWQYYPLVFSSFWVEFHEWGLAPFGYHLDNILLHAVSTFLLWRLLALLEIPAAWLAAAIFAVHPVQVESVAWVTERKNVLCGVFYLAAMLVYFKKPRGYYWIALLFFTCAMLSKTVAATWPLAVLIILWWQTGRVRSRVVLSMIPFVLIGFALGLLTAQLESGQVGATGPDWQLTIADRFIIAGRAVWFYASKALMPIDLTFIYPKWDLHADRLGQALCSASAGVVLVILILFHRKIGRGPAAVAMLFVVTLLPALGFVDVYPMRYSYVADHFQYLAIIALIVSATVLANRLAGKFALVLILPLVVLTFVQCNIYRDAESLWLDTVSKNPNSWMARANLGQTYQAQGRFDDAEAQYLLAATDGPDEPEIWWKLGAFEADRGKLIEGEFYFRHALKVDPTYAPAQIGLAKVLAAEKTH
jgi:protein O-mannosyl-transferase